MNGHWRRVWWAVAALAGAFMGLAGVASSTAAVGTTASPPRAVQYAAGFTVVNATGQTMTYRGASAPGGLWVDDVQPAPVGTQFGPAEQEQFSLTWWFLHSNWGDFTYQLGDDAEHAVVVRTLVGDTLEAMRCVSVPSDLVCSVQGLRAVITSKNPTVHTVTGDQRQQQADLLKGLCDTVTAYASCSFTPTGQLVRTLGEGRIIGENQHFNCKAEGVDTIRLTWGFEEGESNSVGGSFTVGGALTKAIEVAVQVTYNHTWSWSRSYSESHDTQVFPGKWAWMEHYPARIAVTGDFTAVVGNDTFHITGVTFDAPDTETQGLIVSNSRDLTPEERTQYCN